MELTEILPEDLYMGHVRHLFDVQALKTGLEFPRIYPKTPIFNHLYGWLRVYLSLFNELNVIG